jgi:hypothetical protein
MQGKRTKILRLLLGMPCLYMEEEHFRIISRTAKVRS